MKLNFILAFVFLLSISISAQPQFVKDLGNPQLILVIYQLQDRIYFSLLTIENFWLDFQVHLTAQLHLICWIKK